MKKVNLIKVTGVLLFSSFAILSGTKGYAYENGQNDPNTQTQEIKKQDSATPYQQKEHSKNLIQRNQLIHLYQIQDPQIKLG